KEESQSEGKNDPKEQQKEEGSGENEPKQEGEEGQDSPENRPQPKGMRPGKKGFQPKSDMTEEDAKRILEVLKQRETGLQKKLMRQKSKGEAYRDGNEKDW